MTADRLDTSRRRVGHKMRVLRLSVLERCELAGQMLCDHPRVRSKTRGEVVSNWTGALPAPHRWQRGERGARHRVSRWSGETADSKQVTARGKRAVSGQRSVDFARILCFARQRTLN